VYRVGVGVEVWARRSGRACVLAFRSMTTWLMRNNENHNFYPQ
jgi:hypothetical protein